MDNTTMEALREQLMREDPHFRELVLKHQSFEKRLNELASLHFPTEEEQLEEVVLKKKKLAVKDEIYSRLLEYSKKVKLC
ncbi:MAG: DUF465 domain-containing protein [Acidobacteria bacterium]|jgi:uncharacterized protein YdcH (DUF465 family)|nr:MAG: DUF465 domain-containing protein [Acidobacteriota bacterium]GIU81595.1 MAG: hypothetical protein KatS3mg006_0659 [Pyrinomonadaceae bacterium]